MNTQSFVPTAIAVAALIATLENPPSRTSGRRRQAAVLRAAGLQHQVREAAKARQRLLAERGGSRLQPHGHEPIGVFTELEDSPRNKIYVLIPYDSLDVFASVPAKLAADTTYQAAAAEYLAATKADPAFERIESSLHVAFEGMKNWLCRRRRRKRSRGFSSCAPI